MAFLPQPDTSQSSLMEFLRSSKFYVLAAVLALIFVNLFVLNLHNFFLASKKPSIQPVAPPPAQSIAQQTECTGSCLAKIEEWVRMATSSGKTIESVSTLSTNPTSTPIPTQTPIPPTPTPISVSNEYFVPLGTGYGNYSSWTSIPGMSVVIDTSYYPGLLNATFEVLLWTPTGNQTVYVQLYNATTFQTVSGSTVTMSGGTPTLFVNPITLIPGVNTYQVQMNTQLGYNSYINMARIRIRTLNNY